ncbi:hypothetical protein GQX74_002789 [Glossina fuscipes]|nr:hypothetical protein GQX74_002789 [Glossina fuscipes]
MSMNARVGSARNVIYSVLINKLSIFIKCFVDFLVKSKNRAAMRTTTQPRIDMKSRQVVEGKSRELLTQSMISNKTNGLECITCAHFQLEMDRKEKKKYAKE